MDNEFIDEKRRQFLGTSALVLSGAAVAGSVLAGNAAASGQSAKVKGPAVVNYPNDKGVTIERVTYPARNMGTNIVANLFKPANFDSSRKYAAVVVTHPFGAVKEQSSGLYAQRLAEAGFIGLAYDASYQGESGGEPRLMEVPAQRVDDISCAIDFLVQHPQVDPARIGSLGICIGGSYALNHAQHEHRVRAVAAVSTFDIGQGRREGLSNSISYEERVKRLKDAGEQRSREARGEPVRLVPVVANSPDDFTPATPVMYREGYEYYRTARGQHPNSVNRYIFSSLPQQMAFYPFEMIETISPRPLLVIAGSKAETKFWSDQVYEKAREPKELFVVDGATHVDLYDKPQFVGPAIAKLSDFFGQHLTSA
ncbi:MULTISPECIES: alpha/beta hydrolase [unclassified Rhizobium]|uniref:alpha/beta hydrolase n=1 Tax=unclassified Rhizobium TaxID=2613769 RepID=UPI001492724B|nr:MULTISPECIES: alpha/beta hydrolase [unclassified Rhizobium]NNU66098.1 alpha/beta hydrolase [Rhizobium sp. WYCCWR 11152]NYT29823.1 alpha/beta hydrolase [Rhizobium sp. WYCCWR 11128]